MNVMASSHLPRCCGMVNRGRSLPLMLHRNRAGFVTASPMARAAATFMNDKGAGAEHQPPCRNFKTPDRSPAGASLVRLHEQADNPRRTLGMLGLTLHRAALGQELRPGQ